MLACLVRELGHDNGPSVQNAGASWLHPSIQRSKERETSKEKKEVDAKIHAGMD